MKSINFNKIKQQRNERIDSKRMKKIKKRESSNKTESNVEKEKKKSKKFRFWYWFFNIIMVLAIICFIAGIGFCYYIVTSAPEFTKEKLYEKEASRVFD